ncbi:VOC family protein [Brucella thiophenivorans]|uniref:Glyoxalase/Bleomycin resistance /Dioxygenase superfamily protein n=1 Tax=Brucella thiophenivorans TaxID=571255 RepID=A0A256FZ86_9HYPH|nr:VOC family protein [Brucella thiophenivorans]OYR20164.1 glyoxalase/Bleomycin resistance /Dioxygenase superfamily protein [Brucella thiophenivorans]
MTSGIHHLTMITRKVQANVDFYAGFLGLRIVKKTGGFEDAEQLHLFYGDRSGTPGSLITFLVWEDGAKGRVGHGQVSEIALAIDRASIGFWLERALRYHVQSEGPVQEFGEPVLRLRDPDGIILKLVGCDLAASDAWVSGDIPAEHAVRRIRSATILSETPEQTVGFIERYFGFRADAKEGTIDRLVSSSGDVIDVHDASGFWPGIPGTGIADHVAFRAVDCDEIERVEKELAKLNSSETNVHDRKYFASLYVREPGGTLFELATDGPGFTVDEPVESLGKVLFVPPGNDDREAAIRMRMPQFSAPGEERVIYRDLPFVHRVHVPEDPDGTTLVLLHGTGGNEYDLMPLAHKVAPRATLLGVRGRSTEEGTQRWFRRITMDRFDQDDIRSESEAFEAFVDGATKSYELDPDRTVYLGYSNGANLIAAFMRLHPHIVHKAVLLRGIEVLENNPVDDLKDASVLLLTGVDDLYAALSGPLAKALSDSGADLDNRRLPGVGHMLVEDDATIIREWLSDKL